MIASCHKGAPTCTVFDYSLPQFACLQLLDKANEASDRKLARHLVSLYGNGVGRLGNEVRTALGGVQQASAMPSWEARQWID